MTKPGRIRLTRENERALNSWRGEMDERFKTKPSLAEAANAMIKAGLESQRIKPQFCQPTP